MTKPLPLVFNPRSADGRGEVIARKAEAILAERGVVVERVPTASPGGARPLAERLASEGAERILVIGGDGTLSEAADGVLRAGTGTVVGFLPGGTGNSFLRDFGMQDLDAAVARVAEGEARAVDAAVARSPDGERHFINVFGVGFSARVCDLANRRLKWLGSRAYSVAVFPELVRLRSPPTRLLLDGTLFDEPFALVVVANTVHTGGAMKIAPLARPDDGLLDVVALRKVGRASLVRLFTKIFDGSHVGDPRVLHARARKIEIAPSEPSPLLADGEVYGTTPVSVNVLPGALHVLL